VKANGSLRCSASGVVQSTIGMWSRSLAYHWSCVLRHVPRSHESLAHACEMATESDADLSGASMKCVTLLDSVTSMLLNTTYKKDKHLMPKFAAACNSGI
jgi:hypothetical protein